MADFDFKILYDGDCPLCRREIDMLRRRNRRGRLAMEDIADPTFDAGRYGVSQDVLMARIHGVDPEGRLVEGVEVFRRAYAAVGLGWLLAWTRWPGLRRLSDAAYRVFARNRLRWTGRQGPSCDADRCLPANAANAAEPAKAARATPPR